MSGGAIKEQYNLQKGYVCPDGSLNRNEVYYIP